MAGKSYENPLIPHARMRQLYRAMLEARNVQLGRRSGFEACYAGVAIGFRELAEGRIVAADAAPAIALALGLTAARLARQQRPAQLIDTQELPEAERVSFALGIASDGTMTALFATSDALPPPAWKRVLTHAHRRALPILFVALPASSGGAAPAALAQRCGIPAIPVDASDAVAMYRVASESLLRAKSGGGPALLQAVRLPAAEDPLSFLRRQLISKGAATARWLSTLEERVQAASLSEKVH